MSVLLFHSRAKTPIGKILSNFYECEVEFDGKKFRSVEHAYTFAKYLHLEGNAPVPDDVLPVLYGSTAKEAKSLGSKKSMTSRGVKLDVGRFDSQREDIMRQLIKSKVALNPVIQDLLHTLQAGGVPVALYHHSRTDMFWGCHFCQETGTLKRGLNKLGELYMKIVGANKRKIDGSQVESVPITKISRLAEESDS